VRKVHQTRVFLRKFRQNSVKIQENPDAPNAPQSKANFSIPKWWVKRGSKLKILILRKKRKETKS
jgi:hypothetical protein